MKKKKMVFGGGGAGGAGVALGFILRGGRGDWHAVGGAVGAALAWKLLSRAETVDWHAVADKVIHAENSHFVEIDGATVHFQEFGDPSNPTLLLIHGFTASAYVWKTVAPPLADEGF